MVRNKARVWRRKKGYGREDAPCKSDEAAVPGAIERLNRWTFFTSNFGAQSPEFAFNGLVSPVQMVDAVHFRGPSLRHQSGQNEGGAGPQIRCHDRR
jgi:hypothetical protein